MINKREFKNRLYKYCSSETNLRYAKMQIDRLFYSMCILKTFAKDLNPKSHITMLDIGPFVPFASVYKGVLSETTGAKIELKCLELPESKDQSYKKINDIECYFCNIETDRFPFEDDCFDIILLLEVIEHLTYAPFHVLCEVNRLLRKEGFFLLSTPNVVRLANRLKIILGRNIYDCYSREGIYGRHNREYTLKEINELLSKAGFNKISSFSALGPVSWKKRG